MKFVYFSFIFTVILFNLTCVDSSIGFIARVGLGGGGYPYRVTPLSLSLSLSIYIYIYIYILSAPIYMLLPSILSRQYHLSYVDLNKAYLKRITNLLASALCISPKFIVLKQIVDNLHYRLSKK